MSNTYEKLTTITPDKIENRLLSINVRVIAAAKDMQDRCYGRASDGLNFLSDAPKIEAPAVPPAPEELLEIATDEAVGMWHKDHRRNEVFSAVHRDDLIKSNVYHGTTQPILRDSATPEKIVAAIRACDAYAAEFERIAAGYRDTIRRTNAEHAAKQADACRELAGLVAA